MASSYVGKKNKQVWYHRDQIFCSKALITDFRHLSHSLLGFMKLLDNYERSTGVAEQVTADEIAENNAFLDAILNTAVMKV